MGSNFAPVVTTAFILFNVIIFILISAFAMDDVAIGQASNVYEDLNETGEGLGDGDIKSPSFLSRFAIVINDLPWWMSVFIFFANVILIPIIIFSWIRGL